MVEGLDEFEHCSSLHLMSDYSRNEVDGWVIPSEFCMTWVSARIAARGGEIYE